MADSNTPQFDSYIGGSETVPNNVNLSEFIKNRMEEVVMLTETIKESPFRGQTFQRLPKHMRRRQMSHYIKRLPRRLQRPYLLSIKEGLPAPTKRPSRKYRRRPGNLLVEYNRRQKKNVWLETHIWHAKRFHMIKKWNYSLPDRPVNKSFKACYRAISEHCLLTDISYLNCIELKGSEKILLEGLKQCTSPECGLTFAAKMYLDGSREGFVSLFYPNCYPYQIIGNVTYMWEPIQSNNKCRKIWMWVHPLMHDETVECFKSVFDLSLVNEMSSTVEISLNEKDEPENINKPNKKKKRKKEIKKSTKRIEQIKLDPKNVPFIRTPKYTNGDESVTMSLLKDTLNRFRLIGPLSQAIISQAFNIASVTPIEEKESEIEVVEVKSKKRKLDDDIEIIHEEKTKIPENVPENWWINYYKHDAHKKHWEIQKDFYKKLSNCSKPSDIASKIILSLLVEDPRLKIPSKREKAVPNTKDFYQITINSVNSNFSQSPIWDPEIRDKVTMTKLTTFEINEARSQKIVPGFDVNDMIPDEKQSKIPILLVQKPGQNDYHFGKLGLGSGWDIIAPAGFGMPIWLSLIFRGARVGGIRETELLNLECNNLNDYLQPDSAAGESENQNKLEKLKTRYFKLPPNKRANFIKLGVLSPFYCPWNVLIRDWILKAKPDNEKLEIGQQKFSVLRNRKILWTLNDHIIKFPKSQGINFNSFLTFNQNCIVPVVIECLGKGNPKDLAMICLPHEEDLKNLNGSKFGLLEPSHLDENEKLRKILKSEHSKLLKSLRRKRRKDRSKLKEDFARNLPNKLKWKDILKSNSASSKSFSEEYNAKMKSLWIPDLKKIESIISSCSRKILGYVVKGSFSFSKSVGAGVGYVALPGLVELLKICSDNKSKVVVLVRNRNQVQYRFAKLKIAI